MQAIPFITLALQDLHRSVLLEVQDLTAEQMAYRPMAQANTINFLTWHIARTSDNMYHRFVPVERSPSVWEREEWYRRFGLQPQDSGTGFTAEQVGALRPEKELLLGYGRRAFDAVLEGVGHLTDQDLDRAPNPERPELTVARQIQVALLGHGYNHLGELRTIKGLQGMPFPR